MKNKIKDEVLKEMQSKYSKQDFIGINEGILSKYIHEIISLTLQKERARVLEGINLIQKKANQLRSEADIRDMNVIINLVKKRMGEER